MVGDYDERLTLPWWWWPVGIVLAALLAAEVHAGFAWPAVVGITAAFVGVTVALLLVMSRGRVRVAAGVLYAGPARIPVDQLGAVQPLDERQTRLRIGPGADPAAYLFVRSWIRTAVVAVVADPADPTPYWLVSSRHPERLAAAVQAARSAGDADPQPGEQQRAEVPAPGSGDTVEAQPG